MQIIIEVFHRTHLGKDLLDDVFMIAENIFELVWLEIVARLQIDIFSERETAEIVTLHNTMSSGFSSFKRITLEPVNTIFNSGYKS